MIDPGWIRLAHVVSSALMFGVGVGAFFFMTMAVRSGNPAAVAVTTRIAVRAEWTVAVPVALVQPVTGYLLMRELGYALDSLWFAAVAALYVVAGMAWIYLFKAEYRLRRLAASHAGAARLPADFHTVYTGWRRLAVVAFAGVLGLFALMVFRPWLAVPAFSAAGLP